MKKGNDLCDVDGFRIMMSEVFKTKNNINLLYGRYYFFFDNSIDPISKGLRP